MKPIIFGIIFILSLAAVNAATVSHPALQILPGSFQVGTYNFPGILTVGTTLYVNDSSGNVGIGTTEPKALLEVKGGHQVDLFKTADTTSNYFKFRNSNYDRTVLGGYHTDSTETIRFDTDPASANWILGNFGIGTTSPSAKLEVVGDISISGNGKLFRMDSVGGQSCYIQFDESCEAGEVSLGVTNGVSVCVFCQ